MKIKKISLKNFRNFKEASLDFSQKVLIYGPNAKGKTNVLEAIYLVATTRSFRGREVEIINKDADFMRLDSVIEKDTDFDVEIIFEKKESIERTFKIKGKKRPVIDFVGEFSAVVFSPEDINLVSSAPSDKRKYLSYTIGQKDKEYLYNLLNYKKVLKQRNELLKTGDRGIINEEIDIWDEALASSGEKIIKKRKNLEDFINKKLSYYYEKISGEEREVYFNYQPSANPSEFKLALKKSRERDINERTTTVGPHRDSWEILMDGNIVRGFASRGEYRTIILALKLCEKDYFVERDRIMPVILLDDVFSELDEKRRRFLIEAFSGSQLIVTTTDLDHLDERLRKDFQLIEASKFNGDSKPEEKEVVELKEEPFLEEKSIKAL